MPEQHLRWVTSIKAQVFMMIRLQMSDPNDIQCSPRDSVVSATSAAASVMCCDRTAQGRRGEDQAAEITRALEQSIQPQQSGKGKVHVPWLPPNCALPYRKVDQPCMHHVLHPVLLVRITAMKR